MEQPSDRVETEGVASIQAVLFPVSASPFPLLPLPHLSHQADPMEGVVATSTSEVVETAPVAPDSALGDADSLDEESMRLASSLLELAEHAQGQAQEGESLGGKHVEGNAEATAPSATSYVEDKGGEEEYEIVEELEGGQLNVVNENTHQYAEGIDGQGDPMQLDDDFDDPAEVALLAEADADEERAEGRRSGRVKKPSQRLNDMAVLEGAFDPEKGAPRKVKDAGDLEYSPAPVSTVLTQPPPAPKSKQFGGEMKVNMSGLKLRIVKKEAPVVAAPPLAEPSALPATPPLPADDASSEFEDDPSIVRETKKRKLDDLKSRASVKAVDIRAARNWAQRTLFLVYHREDKERDSTLNEKVHMEVKPLVPGKKHRKFWTRRPLASVIADGILDYSRIAYDLYPNEASIGVSAVGHSFSAVNTWARGDQNLTSLLQKLPQLKPQGKPGFMKESIASAILFLALDEPSEVSERELKRARVGEDASVPSRLLNRARLVVTFNDDWEGAQLNDTVWQKFDPSSANPFNLLKHVAKQLIAIDGGATAQRSAAHDLTAKFVKKIDEVEIVLICIVRAPIDPSTLPPMRRIKFSSRVSAELNFVSPSRLQSGFLDLAIDTLNLNLIRVNGLNFVPKSFPASQPPPNFTNATAELLFPPTTVAQVQRTSNREGHRFGDPSWRLSHRSTSTTLVASEEVPINIDTLPTTSLSRLTFNNVSRIDINEPGLFPDSEFSKWLCQHLKKEPLIARRDQSHAMSNYFAFLLHGNEIFVHEVAGPLSPPKSASPWFDPELNIEYTGFYETQSLATSSEANHLTNTNLYLFSDAEEAASSRIALRSLSSGVPEGVASSSSLEKSSRFIPLLLGETTLFDDTHPPELLNLIRGVRRAILPEIPSPSDYKLVLEAVTKLCTGIANPALIAPERSERLWQELCSIVDSQANSSQSKSMFSKLLGAMEKLRPKPKKLTRFLQSPSQIGQAPSSTAPQIVPSVPTPEKYRFYAQHLYDIPGESSSRADTEESVREELRGRESHYVDKRYRAQLAPPHLDEVPEGSLYSLYWRKDENQPSVNSKKTLPFDGYDQ